MTTSNGQAPNDDADRQPADRKAAGPVDASERPDEGKADALPPEQRAEDDALRQRQNIAVAVAVIVLVAAMHWLMTAMAEQRRVEMCVVAHLRACTALDVERSQPQ